MVDTAPVHEELSDIVREILGLSGMITIIGAREDGGKLKEIAEEIQKVVDQNSAEESRVEQQLEKLRELTRKRLLAVEELLNNLEYDIDMA